MTEATEDAHLCLDLAVLLGTDRKITPYTLRSGNGHHVWKFYCIGQYEKLTFTIL